MEQSYGKSHKFARPTPFKATQLWNEAVNILQSGMPTRRHFHRMRYYDNCFSGKEAIEWLSKALTTNPRFGKNVTTEGTSKLLQHFLKSGVFQSVKGTLVFKESGLYEFVTRTIQSPSHKKDRKRLLPHRGLTVIDSNVPPKQNKLPVAGEKQPVCVHKAFDKTDATFTRKKCQEQPSNEEWKDFILNRVQDLLPSLSVELLVDPSTIMSDWVMYNVCPEFENIRKKTELPFWVFTAITSVTRPNERESEYTTYCGFEKDVYTVVRDYLRHRSSPMIPYSLYELIMYTFNHMHYLDLERKNRLREQESVENLMLSMSNEWNEDNLVQMEDLSKTVLPPNSCFETAFTSDEPITRIVPQSSVDTVCLTSNKLTKSASNTKLTSEISKSQSNLLENCESFPLPVGKKTSTTSSKNSNKRRTALLRRTQSMAQIDKVSKWNTLPVRPSVVRTEEHGSAARATPQHQSYINYGLSQSMDDLLAVDDNVGLDFEEAMQSVNCLMQASCGLRPSPNSGPSDFVSSSYESLSTVNSCPFNKADLVCIDSCLWDEDIQETARLVFQSMLMLMSPVSRTSLRMLLQFIDQLSVPLNCSITKTEMVYDLSAHILSPGPNSKNTYSHHLVLSVVYFLVDNCKYVFGHFQNYDLMASKESPSRDTRFDQAQKVYCEQLTKNQFEDQGVTSSWIALAELLDQIINDKKMKSKEKRKRLKKFKEAYPHIYKQRFGGSTTNLAALMHFR